MANTPFKFLDAYQKEDFDHFFGRKRETTRLYNAVHASNLVLLYGASGTGKSSLVNCGLANKFYESDWHPIFIRRAKNMIESIRFALFRVLDEEMNPTISLQELIRIVYREKFRTIYLIFDQFEEFFVLGNQLEQQEFYQAVAELLKAKLPCKILIILREEYLAYLSAFEKVVPSLFDNRIRIEKMNDINLYRVVQGTAKYTGIEISTPKETIPVIVDNIRNPREGVELAHLQIYLERLYREDEKRKNAENSERPVRFDLDLIDKNQELKNVIADFVQEQLRVVEHELLKKEIGEEGQALEILFTLVTDEGTKRIMTQEGIVESVSNRRNIMPKTVRYCIDRFNELKLIRILPDD